MATNDYQQPEPQCAARDTSVEGRLGDLENTVRNEQEVQRRYWRAVEQGGELADRERDRLVKRIEALEAGRVEDRDYHKRLILRVQALERDHSLERQAFRIDALEQQQGRHALRMDALALSIAHPTPDNPLLVRVERLERAYDNDAEMMGMPPGGYPSQQQPGNTDYTSVMASKLNATAERVDALREFADRMLKRISPLESKVEDWDRTLRNLDIFSYLDQRERENRWHETYNSVLEIIDDPTSDGNYLGNGARRDHMLGEYAESAHRKAVVQANRAHGPLEDKTVGMAEYQERLAEATRELERFRGLYEQAVKGRQEFRAQLKTEREQTKDDGWDPNTHATVRSYTSYGQTTHWVKLEDVDALVKAAQAIDETALSQALTGAEWKALVMNLRAALKPFEVDGERHIYGSRPGERGE